MPIKIVLMLTRKPGMSPEAFREYYENGHSRLAWKLFGHLCLSYRRTYLAPAQACIDSTERSGTIPAPSPGIDVITEMVYPDQAALDESGRIALVNSRIIAEDEERLFDRAKCWMTICEVSGEDIGPKAAA